MHSGNQNDLSSRNDSIRDLSPLWSRIKFTGSKAFQQLCLKIPVSHGVTCDERVALDDSGYGAGPTGLMTRPDAGTVVAMEILMELDEVPPVGVVLEFLGPAINGAHALFIPLKCGYQPLGKFMRDVDKIQVLARTGRALHGEAVAVVGTQPEERGIEHEVHRHPDGSPPVRITAEHAAVGFTWLIRDRKLMLPLLEDERMIQVVAR